MKVLRSISPFIVVLILIIIGSFFTVREGQQILITQFGKPIGKPYTKAGLYLKIPLIQEIHLFDKRLLKWDGKPNEIPTRDKKYIWVDYTARWRIINPLRFLQTVGNEAAANSRLDDIIDSVVRDMVSSNLLVELVRSSDWDPNPPKELAESGESLYSAGVTLTVFGDASTEPADVKHGRQIITRAMLSEASKLTPEYGIKLVDIQIKRINYVESVQKRVFERMISERKRIASQYRSEGEGEKNRILGSMEKELARIRSEAYKKSQEIRGQAEAKTTTIYGQAFGADAQFYSLFKTLESYIALPKGKAEMILSTDGEYFRNVKKIP